jgi:Leucine-rich repeat (LRR) protein
MKNSALLALALITLVSAGGVNKDFTQLLVQGAKGAWTSLVSPVEDSPNQNGQCGPGDNEDDCRALLDIWHAAGSFPGKFADGTPLCSWVGIKCSRGRVSELDFFGGDIHCPFPHTGVKLPDSIGLLKSLRTISMEQLNLEGTVPASLGSLPRLELLLLSFNGLSGTVPASLGSLSKLTALQLEANKLTGTVPDSWGKLTSLTELALNDNEITAFPNSICALTSGYPNNGKLTDCAFTSNPLKSPCAPCAKDKCRVFDSCN